MDYTLPRLLADGVEYVDLIRIVEDLKSLSKWCSRWVAAASAYEKRANQLLANGGTVTAGEALWRASLYYHYGQFLEWHDRPLKKRVVKKKVEAYNRGAPLFMPPSERIEIPFENTVLPGFLRLPLGGKKPPCVLLIGGLESTKEEYYAFENLCLRRGLATFAFDGPGQGEVYYSMKARPDFEKATSAVIDYLRGRDEIDIERLGVIGRSLGGYFAPRSAAFDKRIKACVAWAVIYDFSTWNKMSTALKDGFTYIADKKDWERARDYYESFTLKGVAKKITCPLYVLQGELDDICPPEQARWLAREAGGPTELDIVKGGTHCAHNLGHIYRPKMADWLAETLDA